MLKPIYALLFAGLTTLAATLSAEGNVRPDAGLPMPVATVDDAPPLSVMTYNVNGLPWPIATGREAALARIADRLAAMRRAGRQPRIVLLQEAFTPEAEGIARRAGYTHVAMGPGPALASGADPAPDDLGYLRAARWDRGEGIGKRLGSGLIILSDYPIVAVERMAFPDFACAGFDCLANKGVVLARLRVPGRAGLVTIVNTHLNSRKASGVPIERSQRAYDRQVALLAGFLQRHAPRGAPLLIGGDMNIGRDPARADAFFGAFARAGMGFVTPRQGGLRRALGEATRIDGRIDGATRGDLAQADRKGKDWLFARTAAGAPMPIGRAHAPFGAEADGAPLSDHVGYVIDYAPPGGRGIS